MGETRSLRRSFSSSTYRWIMGIDRPVQAMRPPKDMGMRQTDSQGSVDLTAAVEREHDLDDRLSPEPGLIAPALSREGWAGLNERELVQVHDRAACRRTALHRLQRWLADQAQACSLGIPLGDTQAGLALEDVLTRLAEWDAAAAGQMLRVRERLGAPPLRRADAGPAVAER
jgi:hypothetical protein